MHKNELIWQKCAINCGIEGNDSNENITKYKNLSGVKSISNSVQRLARYRIVTLISIGQLCTQFRILFCWLHSQHRQLRVNKRMRVKSRYISFPRKWRTWAWETINKPWTSLWWTFSKECAISQLPWKLWVPYCKYLGDVQRMLRTTSKRLLK